MTEDVTAKVRTLGAALRGEQPRSGIPAAEVARTLIVGRAGDCDLRVDDEYASLHHCRITERTDGTVWVEDLGATNTTRVAPMRGGEAPTHTRMIVRGLTAYGPRQIGPGWAILVGQTVIPWRAQETT